MNPLSTRGTDEHSDTPLVSVIIPAHDSASTLDLCLQAVAESNFTDFEVIVVCDGCVDLSAEIAEARDVRVIRYESHRGAAYARNVGAVAALGKIFFFVDADCILNPDALSIAVRTIGAGDQVIFGSYIDETRVPGFFSRFKNYQHHFTHQNADPVQISFWSGCGAITRRAFENLNGFDVSIRGIEDIEFGYALTQRGYTVKLVKSMRVEHLKRYTLVSLIKSDLFSRAVPWTRLVASGRMEFGKLNTARGGVYSTLLTGLIPAVAPFRRLGVRCVFRRRMRGEFSISPICHEEARSRVCRRFVCRPTPTLRNLRSRIRSRQSSSPLSLGAYSGAAISADRAPG